jgi:hypothetical protein
MIEYLHDVEQIVDVSGGDESVALRHAIVIGVLANRAVFEMHAVPRDGGHPIEAASACKRCTRKARRKPRSTRPAAQWPPQPSPR